MTCRYDDFTTTYQPCFRSGNHDVSPQANRYLRGLMQTPKRNMERMAEAVPDTDYQALQNFLTHSHWDHQAVMEKVSQDANAWLGGSVGSALYIDESGHSKKGKKSVGVARQYNGRLGKVDNCQVAVYGALGKGHRVGLIDARLYLPEQWTQDPERCAQADIPRQHQVYKTKHELALEIVAQARRRGVEFEWVGMDGLYGMSMSLLQALDDQGEVFVADIHKDRHIYLSDPAPTVPASPAGRGRKRQRYHSNEPALEVQAWVKNQPESAWRQKSLREGEQGPMNVKVLHQRVWLWDKKSSTPRQWHLLVRREPDSPQTLKYSLSNAPVRTSVVRLARMQSQRYWIERAFQDAKSHLGMGHYQARKWQSWYRHMALVMMAYQFMLQERIQQADSYPLLSCYDIQILMARTLPSNQSNSRAVIEQIHQRHQKRQAAMDSAKRRRSRSLKKTARS